MIKIVNLNSIINDFVDKIELVSDIIIKSPNGTKTVQIILRDFKQQSETMNKYPSKD